MMIVVVVVVWAAAVAVCWTGTSPRGRNRW